VDLVEQFRALDPLEIEMLKRRPRRIVVQVSAALATLAGQRFPEPGYAAFDRGQRGVDRLGHWQRDNPVAETVEVDLHGRGVVVTCVVVSRSGLSGVVMRVALGVTGLAVLGAVGVIFVFSGRPAFGEGTEWRRRRR